MTRVDEISIFHNTGSNIAPIVGRTKLSEEELEQAIRDAFNKATPMPSNLLGQIQNAITRENTAIIS